MSVSITPSPFGTLSVSLADIDGTLSADVMATAPASLSMALGVPGPGFLPTVQNNGGGYNNGQFSTVHYPKELLIVISGTTYAVPARIKT